ncbi:hypothetical protein SMACR_01440 [Sordaria macrospora]|uniref:WGS project CABT00000000 data, contig 2.4 n=2 Tax=Sordaria macrospora TaxID=5147 RepID=F7VQU3_SORMK|nr:uncharacterized protein SMAC_01440 [Sordaria macrospora k-hell]KAA8633044.1 hypothetical protein SMACR_01440 [Sordaria macrospora]KAH7634532.1 hypothetical protein B0T09DRAFT_7524 [Sordaria sp. MPI-SDFR-AT-0083]WPJ58680.1 hypothetical protein SMAC4_01440 [Sordaria macrospora]CCC07875.1 unnamed protein product [Sordaria macrospora k-hell]
MGPITTTLTTLLSLTTLALAESPAGTPRINSISYSGSGCPQTQAKFSGSLNDPTLTFNHFAIEYPNTVNRTANCQVHLQAKGVSAGWQVSIKDTFVDGHVTLDPGAALDYFSTVYYSSSADDAVTSKGTLSNDGSSRIDKAVTLQNHFNARAWSSCTTSSDDGFGILNINFRGALRNEKSYFEATSETWDLDWRRC